MLTNANFSHFLLQFKVRKGSVTLCFYNYLKYHTDITSIFCKNTVQEFINGCLSFKFWQNHRSSLEEALLEIYKKYPQKDELDFGADNIRYLCSRRIVCFEDEADIIPALQRNEKEDSQILKINNHEYLQLQSNDKRMSAKIHGTSFLIQNGVLKPLSNWRSLKYNKSFELDPDEFQQIKMDDEVLCRLHISTNSGVITKGHCFDKMSIFKDDHSIIEAIKLNIKNMEQHYLKFGTNHEKKQAQHSPTQ